MAKEKIDVQKQILLMLGYLCVKDEGIEKIEQKVEILDIFELSGSDIAKICKVKEQAIKDARQRLKKKK